jgi:hypothetical protein
MSVTNFEEFTHELTSEEMEILPIVVHGFRNYKKENPIKSELIVTRMNEYLNTKGYKTKMNGPRLRKIVNYIRTNGIIPLIANSNGYFTTDCKKTIEEQINSLNQRANSIKNCAIGLQKFL